jgi:hypothetical protein
MPSFEYEVRNFKKKLKVRLGKKKKKLESSNGAASNPMNNVPTL